MLQLIGYDKYSFSLSKFQKIPKISRWTVDTGPAPTSTRIHIIYELDYLIGDNYSASTIYQLKLTVYCSSAAPSQAVGAARAIFHHKTNNDHLILLG
jgi:hypothetical protein